MNSVMTAQCYCSTCCGCSVDPTDCAFYDVVDELLAYVTELDDGLAYVTEQDEGVIQ